MGRRVGKRVGMCVSVLWRAVRGYVVEDRSHHGCVRNEPTAMVALVTGIVVTAGLCRALRTSGTKPILLRIIKPPVAPLPAISGARHSVLFGIVQRYAAQFGGSAELRVRERRKLVLSGRHFARAQATECDIDKNTGTRQNYWNSTTLSTATTAHYRTQRWRPNQRQRPRPQLLRPQLLGQPSPGQFGTG